MDTVKFILVVAIVLFVTAVLGLVFAKRKLEMAISRLRDR